jgi:hypothetical protein
MDMRDGRYLGFHQALKHTHVHLVEFVTREEYTVLIEDVICRPGNFDI